MKLNPERIRTDKSNYFYTIYNQTLEGVVPVPQKGLEIIHDQIFSFISTHDQFIEVMVSSLDGSVIVTG